VINGKTIICFASGWDYHPTSKHHVMRKLSEANQIIWVNWHASRRPKVGAADLRTVISKLRQIRSGPKQVSPSITVITPAQLPLPGSPFAQQMNVRLVRRAINKVLSRLPQRPVQIWSFAPDISDMVGHFGEELVLYYCVDAFGEFPGYDRELIERRERELMARSQVVITTSPPLYESRRQQHANVVFVKHGVDHAHLSRAITEMLPMPADLKGLPRPIIGFVGMVGEWVDLNLVADFARRRPRNSVVMIGPETGSRGPCAGLPNIHWLGGRDHALLPGYLRHFDVGLIPFKHVPLTHNANPIKLYEYLAAGVPVVSTSLPAVDPIPGSVWLADDADAMADAVQHAGASNDPALRAKRSQLMLAESWTARLEQISASINDVLCPPKLEHAPRTVPAIAEELEPVCV
jgi:glycosyltransferase involved in cell wall biosynthesis